MEKENMNSGGVPVEIADYEIRRLAYDAFFQTGINMKDIVNFLCFDKYTNRRIYTLQLFCQKQGVFKTPDELYNWINEGIIPDWMDSETMNAKVLKSSVVSEIPKYWYLRDDLLPEGIENYPYGPITKEHIKMLRNIGNLFQAKEDAMIASEKIKEAFLSIKNPQYL